MNPRLKDIYDKKIVSALMAKLKYKNKNQVPKLLKIILNMGLGADASDGKKIKTCVEDMSLISGQKAVITNIAHLKDAINRNAGTTIIND